MTRTVAVLGAAGSGKSTLVDRMCGVEGTPGPASDKSDNRPRPCARADRLDNLRGDTNSVYLSRLNDGVFLETQGDGSVGDAPGGARGPADRRDRGDWFVGHATE